MVSYLRTCGDATLANQVICRGLLAALLAPIAGMFAGAMLIVVFLILGGFAPGLDSSSDIVDGAFVLTGLLISFVYHPWIIA